MALDDSTPITEKAQLIAEIESGCKPKEQWRIGTEHEKFGFRWEDLRPLSYDGPQGIRKILEELACCGWALSEEHGKPIGLTHPDGSSITLEPGGQLELSGAPLETIHETCGEVNRHLTAVRQVSDDLDVGFLGMGFHPKWALEDMHWMPKGRYQIMRDYMPRVGVRGHDMMLRTCTVQVNLDYSDEADMVKKFRTSLALQPFATALFANSPFVEGKPSGYLSLRSHAWSETDPDRTGMLPFVFDQGMGYERWVDYVLDVPMYFVYRDGKYIDASGQSFRAFLDGKLPALPGEKPTMKDWRDHMTTIFPEVRLKTFLEMRGADGGPWARLCALPAFWVGLLYEQSALDAACDMVKDWSAEERQQLRDDVPRLGLRAEIDGNSVLDLSREILDISHAGLAERKKLNASGDDETGFLEPLRNILRNEKTPAEVKLERYLSQWGQSVDPLFREYAY